MLTNEQLTKARDFIFRQGRLLARKLYERFFEGGSTEACLQALLAYRNADGGFGNGIEPDLMCPDSTAIGAESALFVLDLLDDHDPAIVDPLVNWIVANQDEAGTIPHPPAGLHRYPHQPWWENPDDGRILVLAGLLRKWGIAAADVFAGARRFYEAADLPAADNFYGYPHFAYLTYCGEDAEDREKLATMVVGLSTLLASHGDHFPFWSRYWFYAADAVEEDVLRQGAETFAAALQDDGGLLTPYPDLPWWRPIFTLDGLILMRKRGLVRGYTYCSQRA